MAWKSGPGIFLGEEQQKNDGKRPQERTEGIRAAGRKGGSVMSRKCIGIDIGGTTVKLGMFEQDGTLLEKWEIPTRKENGSISSKISRTGPDGCKAVRFIPSSSA